MTKTRMLPAQAIGHQAAKKEKTMAQISRMAALALVTALAGIVSGCGSMKPSREVTGSIPDDYRTRHPISIAEVRHTMDVPVASGDRNLNVAVRDAIRGFAQDYASTSSATMQISLPQGGINAGAAQHARAQIRKVLMDAGIPGARMIETTYPVTEPNASHPVKLSYVAITAMTNECGTWPKDLISNTEENVNYENFGCATQKNLAAQIANPMDLVAPRAMTPIDAERRSEVIRVYREGS
jgi:pilus assembly protein CpaD